jgi:two-component system KDP operon response regulator KdpE
VVTTGSSHELLALLHRMNPELVYLDAMVGESDGFEILREVRALSRVPVVMFFPSGSDDDVVRALCEGADHCLLKPLNPNELLAATWAVLRRVEWERFGDSRWQTIQSNSVYIDFEAMRAVVNGEEIRLTRTEWNLLKVLVGKAGRVVSHQELLTRVWGIEYRDDIQYLREWMSRLRRKLRGPNDAGLIRTIHGMGYIIDKAWAEAQSAHSTAS